MYKLSKTDVFCICTLILITLWGLCSFVGFIAYNSYFDWYEFYMWNGAAGICFLCVVDFMLVLVTLIQKRLIGIKHKHVSDTLVLLVSIPQALSFVVCLPIILSSPIITIEVNDFVANFFLQMLQAYLAIIGSIITLGFCYNFFMVAKAMKCRYLDNWVKATWIFTCFNRR